MLARFCTAFRAYVYFFNISDFHALNRIKITIALIKAIVISEWGYYKISSLAIRAIRSCNRT